MVHAALAAHTLRVAPAAAAAPPPPLSRQPSLSSLLRLPPRLLAGVLAWLGLGLGLGLG